jgi:hypothetical protein
MFEPKGQEFEGGSRKLNNNGLHNFQTSPNIIRVVRSKRTRWVDNVVRMGETRKA